MKPSVPQSPRAAVLVATLHALTALIFLTPGYIRPDSVGIYAYLRSLIIDGDLLFLNEWAGFGMIRGGFTQFKEVTSLSTLADHWWIGTSLLSAPFYLLAHLFTRLTGDPADGFSRLYAVTLAWSSVVFGTVTFLVADRMLEKLTGIAMKARLLLLAALWIGTPLLWYELRFPLGSHMAGALCVAALCAAIVRDEKQTSDVTAVIIGLALGLATATRIQHVVLAAPVVIYALLVHRTLRFYLHVLLGMIPGLLVQGLAWWVIYGHPLGPLVSGANLGATTWMPFHTVTLGAVLFSSYHGLLSWSPIAALSLIGLARGLFSRSKSRQSRIILATFALMVLIEWLVNGTADRYFWGGMSFGPRRFIDLAVPLAIGLGLFWTQTWRPLAFTSVALSVSWSLLLTAVAISGQLDLSRDVTGPQLVRTAGSLSMPLFWRSLARGTAASDLLQFRNSLVSIAIIAILVTLAVLLVRNLRRAVVVIYAYLSICALAVAMSFTTTRSRGAGDIRAFGIDRAAAARLGPLTDQRTLLLDEARYYGNRKMIVDLRATEAEIHAIDQLISRLKPDNR